MSQRGEMGKEIRVSNLWLRRRNRKVIHGRSIRYDIKTKIFLRQVRRFFKANMKILNLNEFTEVDKVFLNEFILQNKYEPKPSFTYKSYNKKYIKWLLEFRGF